MLELPFHDRAVIVSTGDEILTGQLQDSNARWLSEQLVDIGIVPIEHVAVGDALPDLVATIQRAASRAPLVVMSGGLGPTDGDLTRQALCELLGEELVTDEPARKALAAMLTSRGRAVSDRQLRQAQRPRSARCLANAMGTAPGLHVRVSTDAAHGMADVLALPGPPGELRPMFDRQVRGGGLLRVRAGRVVLTRLLHVVGVAEADCVAQLRDLTRRDRSPLVGVTASGGILTIRVRCESDQGFEQARSAVDADEGLVRATLGNHVFAQGAGVGSMLLAETVLSLLRERRQTLSTIESCTGGMLGEIITTVPGSSAAYVGGFVTYANEQKVRLGVNAKTLGEHGAVSAAVAEQLASCGLAAGDADHCLAITGVAGPDGGTAAKPVGTVHIALASQDRDGAVSVDIRTRADVEGSSAARALRRSVHTRHFVFSGDRDDIRRRAAMSALAMVYFALKGHVPRGPRLLWQVG